MTSAAASAPFVPFSGPFAIGALSAAGETRFPGLVAPDGRALDLRTALDEPALTTLALLERWDEERSTPPSSKSWTRTLGTPTSTT
ncbi:hypothetical protein OG426_05375 [Streptomyces canus]|uniref:hypothetical protein n=1 Tax=Streptomyces canus TaxID=58343 RepID=UPI00386F5710|nr:hypothetical protein OG426_05375 [Streptomyces canus]